MLRSGNDPSGTTPVSADEVRFLIPSVATNQELNQRERENILSARRWAFAPRVRRTPADLLDHVFVRELHRRMFNEVWRWAGKTRNNQLNLGVPVAGIETRFVTLLDDARGWIEFEAYPADEICVRLHHGLVFIHPWRNGNGRHARLMADRLAVTLGHSPFTWGGGADLTAKSDTRANYLTALKTADGGDFAPLVIFARS